MDCSSEQKGLGAIEVESAVFSTLQRVRSGPDVFIVRQVEAGSSPLRVSSSRKRTSQGKKAIEKDSR